MCELEELKKRLKETETNLHQLEQKYMLNLKGGIEFVDNCLEMLDKLCQGCKGELTW